MADFRHRYATRLNSFRTGGADAGPVDASHRIVDIAGLTAVELNYPQHLPRGREADLIDAATERGLDVTALNLRFDAGDFAQGAFTNPDASVRDQALGLTGEAVDLAARHGIGHVILWMGQDGFDYPFQVDYARLWGLEIEGFRATADRQPSVRVSVEYKPSDPRRTSLIRSMGESLLAVHAVDRTNFGVTIDFCHSLMAGEQPAAAAALALRAGKLFGVHLNDGYGPADDGLMVGSVHAVQTLEFLWVLRRHGFAGTIYFDTFPERIDPAAECAANIAAIERMEAALDDLDDAALAAFQDRQDAIGATALVARAMWRR